MLKQLIDIQCYNMKTKKLKRVPQYAFGADAISNWGNMSGVDKANVVTQGVGAVGSMMIGNATSGKKPTAAGVIGGIGSGAAMGASIGGPWGAVIGGAIGGITSSIGSGGSVNEQTGEYELPSGIAGLFGHSKSYIRNKAGRIKNGIQARQMSEQVAADYYQENGYNELSLSKGGVVPSTMAYLDDGEMLRTPDGTIGSIPEEGKPTDSNLLNVPVGTQVLSDKLKVPGTNKTFAEMGKKLMKKSKKKVNNIYAENSQMLNERNNQATYQSLLEQQESLKNKKNSKKQQIPSYENGTSGVYGRKNDIRNDLLPDSMWIWNYNDFEDIEQPITLKQDTVSKSTHNVNKRDFLKLPNKKIKKNTPTIFNDHAYEVAGKKYQIGDTFEYKGKQYKVTGNNEAVPVNKNDTDPKEIDGGFNWNLYRDVFTQGEPRTIGPSGAGRYSTYQQNKTTDSIPNKKIKKNTPMIFIDTDPKEIDGGFNWNLFRDVFTQGEPRTIGPSGAGRYSTYQQNKTTNSIPNANDPYFIGNMYMNGNWGDLTVGKRLSSINPEFNTPALGVIGTNTSDSYSIPTITQDTAIPQTAVRSTPSTKRSTVQTSVQQPVQEQVTGPIQPFSNDRPSLTELTSKPSKVLPKLNIGRPFVYNPSPDDAVSNGLDMSSLYSTVATLAPLFDRERAEKVDAYTYNPVYGPTNYNIDPILREATLSDRIARYNMANINPNTGANMAFGLQSAVNRNKTIANAYATKNNAENQMAFNNAQIANQWGQQYADARHIAATEYAQNKANARNINRRNFASALNNWGASLRDKKQTSMDMAALEMLQPMLNYGTEDNVLNRVNKILNRVKNG